jgi:hypothetical protein
VSSRRSYKIHREILPFEWHSRNVNLSYSLLEHALYWQEEFPGDRKRYMRARKFNRGAQFFKNANRGKCAKKHGVCIETILEGDEVCGDMDDVVPVEVRKYLFEEEWFDVRSDHDEEETEEDLKKCASVVTSYGSTEAVETWASVGNIENPELDGDNHDVTNKTREEVVGTFVGVTTAPVQKPTVEPKNNSSPPLGSGFYVDNTGRTRRFSHRLLAKKSVGK